MTEPILDLWAMTDLVTPMTLRVAATLRVADHLADRGHTAAELADITGANEIGLEGVLLHLVAIGVLDRNDDAQYTLTDLGAGLRDDHPLGMRAAIDIQGSLGRAELSFAHLLHSVRTGEAAYDVMYGRGFWEDIAADPDLTTEYNAAMGSDVRAWAPAIIDAYDWASIGHLVDVGGGNGTLLIELLRAFPGLRGTVFDQPATADEARAAIGAADLSTRAAAVGGDFFEPLPAGADAYVLTAIIHDWDDERSRTLLRRCAEAAAPDGRVIVIEKIGNDGETPNTKMNLRLLAYMAGRERTIEELVALADSAGLRTIEVHRAGAIVLVELVAA